MTAAAADDGGRGPRALADALARRDETMAASMLCQGLVVGAQPGMVLVSIAGNESLWPRLQSYSPSLGDVVLMAGAPGSWVVLGAIS